MNDDDACGVMEAQYIRRHHRHHPKENQCTSAVFKNVRAPVPLVWSLVRRFDQPQKYKPFVSRCVVKGDLGIGSVREVNVKSGLPATTSTERLELLDDKEHILGRKMSTHPAAQEPNVPLLQSKSLIQEEDDAPLSTRIRVESRKLWHIVGPAVFSRVASYSMLVITQAFAGHLGDLELAAMSIANNVIVGFDFGLLLGMASALETLCGQGLTSLVTINLGTNSISGSIPTQLSNIPNLKNLIIAVNNLSGTVPPGIYNMSSLVTLTLASNHLWGTFPKDIGEKLPNLLVFIFCFNKFTGTIPESMHNITRIRIIRFGDNFLEGTVPPGLEKLTHLSMYNIRYNKLVGSDANGGLNFITSLTNCSRLAFLTLEGNKFEGVIPDSIGNLSKELSKLYMGENRFYGKIPTTISNLHGLTLLNMSDNSLSGEIPAQIGKLDKLQVLLMARNRLSGSIPSSLGDLRMLNQIDLSGNELVGNIPTSFGNFKNLLHLDLSKNKLNGSIPRETLTLPALSKHLNLSNNLLSGSLPKEIGSLQNVVAIDISNNLISGNIPPSISSCKSLEVLIMARNKLSGPIPRTFDVLRGLQLLDLSSNHLSGPIPDELQRLNALRTLNLSFNDLEGVVPMEFRNITNLYLQGNPKLCDGYFSCAATGTKGKVIKIAVVSVLSALLAMLLVFGTVVYFMRRKSKVPLSLSTEWVKGKPEMISHRELCLATDNFCPENMIGKGSFGTVYRGCLEQGIGIAVKVFNTERAGSVRSFLAECEALRHVRHRNLVKLITSCSSIDLKQQEFLALVYEFLSNGSLDSWIHQHKLHENGTGLNLVERLNIAIDVASAMDYLHNGYDVPIVHCDLKPSNIILSEDMTAKVGDFGLSRFLMEGETNQSSSITSSRVLKGSIGYVPPEYGVGRKATRAGDVYSFGVTLVELFTGKRPTDEGFSGELSLMKWVELGYPNNMDEVVDAALLESRFNLYYEQQKINPRKQYDCLVDVMGVGLCCTANSPDKRISMEDVFVKLKTIRATLVHHSNGNNE